MQMVVFFSLQLLLLEDGVGDAGDGISGSTSGAFFEVILV